MASPGLMGWVASTHAELARLACGRRPAVGTHCRGCAQAHHATSTREQPVVAHSRLPLSCLFPASACSASAGEGGSREAEEATGTSRRGSWLGVRNHVRPEKRVRQVDRIHLPASLAGCCRAEPPISWAMSTYLHESLPVGRAPPDFWETKAF